MTEKEALLKLQTICSKQEKCSFDVKKKLSEWDISEEISEKIIKKLIADKFIDDERYAKAFVKDKFRFNNWGKIKISMQLRMKKIKNDVIENALYEISEEDYEKFIINELTKKRRSIKDTDKYVIKGKLIRYGQSKGIEFEKLTGVIDKLYD